MDVGSYDAWWWNHPPMYLEKGMYRPYARMVKEVVHVPVICAGRMDDPNLAAEAVRSGACDIVSLGRPLLADADYVNKLWHGQTQAIRPCLSCQEGCMGRIGKYALLNCAVNPTCCREADHLIQPTRQKKRVLIAGGGPAGCEAARVLALRGHYPILYEKEAELGGNLLPGGVPAFKSDDRALAQWYAHELSELKVEVHLNSIVTAETPKEVNADAAIIAVGGIPSIPEVFAGQHTVCTAADALLGRTDVGETVIIVGGSLIACETALWFRQQGKSVTLIVRGEKLLRGTYPSCKANHDMLERLVYHEGIQVITQTRPVAVNANELIVTGPHGEATLTADTIVLATGYESNDSLYKALEEWSRTHELHVVGDARHVANIMYAVWDAFEVARNL